MIHLVFWAVKVGFWIVTLLVVGVLVYTTWVDSKAHRKKLKF